MPCLFLLTDLGIRRNYRCRTPVWEICLETMQAKAAFATAGRVLGGVHATMGGEKNLRYVAMWVNAPLSWLVFLATSTECKC